MLISKPWVKAASSRASSSASFAFPSVGPRSNLASIRGISNCKIMNLRYASSVATLVMGSSSAWTYSTTLHRNPATTTHSDVKGWWCRRTDMGPAVRSRWHSSSSLHQSALAEEMDTTNQEDATTPPPSPSTSGGRGQPVARGSILNVFRGGLVAIRLDDDLIKQCREGSAGSSSGADATQTVPSKPSSSSNSRGGDLIGRQVVFDTDGTTGVVVVHRPPLIYVYTDELMEGTKTSEPTDSVEGTVTVLENLFAITVPDNLRRVDCFGKSGAEPEVGGSGSGKLLSRPIFSPIPQVKDIALINNPLVTGVTMFDALAPIGKGQNMLLIGHDIGDMRRYVCDMLTIQIGKGAATATTAAAASATPASTKCIYAATGGKDDQNQVRSLLEAAGLSDDVVLVTMNEDKKDSDEASDAAEATAVAATACAIAESFALEEGMDTFVIVDNINQHKKLWDVTTRVLVDVFGVDSVVKGDRDGGASSEMRAFFSSLVQRSAQFKPNRGGGSVTLLLLQMIPRIDSGNDDDAVFSPDDFEGSPDKVRERIKVLVEKKIPLTAGNLRRIQIPVPSAAEGMSRFALQHVDELISMSDGQIWLDERLEQSGRRPPMDFQRSVTRIGIGADTVSRADAPAMRRVVEGLRLDLSQAVSMDGAETLTKASRLQMRNAQAWLLAMYQPSSSGARKLSESCVAMLAASIGALNDSIDRGVQAGSLDGELLVRNLLEHVNAVAPEAMNEIDSTLDFSQETKDTIERAIQSFVDR